MDDFGFEDYGQTPTLMTDTGEYVGGDFPEDGGFLPVQYGGIVSGAASRFGGMLGRGAAAAGGAAVRLGGRAAGYIMTSAGKFSVRKLWAVARRFGPEVAAGIVGYSVADLMAVFASSGVIMSSVGHHRRRGISSRDIRTTKRVVNFVNRMSQQIGCVHRPHFTRHRKRA